MGRGVAVGGDCGVSDNLAAVVDREAKAVEPPSVPRSCIVPALYEKARIALLEFQDQPTIWPLSLMPFASLSSSCGSLPRFPDHSSCRCHTRTRAGSRRERVAPARNLTRGVDRVGKNALLAEVAHVDHRVADLSRNVLHFTTRKAELPGSFEYGHRVTPNARGLNNIYFYVPPAFQATMETVSRGQFPPRCFGGGSFHVVTPSFYVGSRLARLGCSSPKKTRNGWLVGLAPLIGSRALRVHFRRRNVAISRRPRRAIT